MKNTLVIAAAIVTLIMGYKYFKGQPQGTSLGNGWTLNPDGVTATGPNGQQAMYTGYQTGDPYPSGGMLTLNSLPPGTVSM